MRDIHLGSFPAPGATPGVDAMKKPTRKGGSATVQNLYDLFGADAVFLCIPRGRKGPMEEGWQSIAFEATQAAEYQRSLAWHAEHANIGVRQGDNLQSIDCDDDELVKAFVDLNPILRDTTVTKAKRGCQFHLRVKGAYPNGQGVYKIAHKSKRGSDGKPLKVMEWRCGGGGLGSQSVISGEHPDGVRYWCNQKKVIEVEFDTIRWPAELTLPWVGESQKGDGAADTQEKPQRKGSELLAAEQRQVSVEDFYAYMPQHNYIFVPTRDFWPASSINARIKPLPLFRNGKQVRDADGKKQFISASGWLDQNRPVEQMTWVPGEPMLIKDLLICAGGWIERRGCTTFNLYIPPNIEPGDGKKAGMWIEHVKKLYPEEATHIIAWLAHRVQRPEEKINHALFLGGDQGIGKDTILYPVKQAVGAWNVQEILPPTLLGRFNGFVKSVILCINEVHDLGDLDRYAFYERLKAYTAVPPEMIRVDEKHLREYMVFNVCGVILTSNYKTGGLYLPADDRRHYVAWSHTSKDNFRAGYWQDIYAWYDCEGSRHVAAYLSQLDISSFCPKAPPPKSNAFWEIVESNRAPENAELADALDELGNPDAVTVKMVIDVLPDTNQFKYWLGERKNSRQIPHWFEEVGYVAVRNSAEKEGRWKIGKRSYVIYAKKTLSVRDQIIAARRCVEKIRSCYLGS